MAVLGNSDERDAARTAECSLVRVRLVLLPVLLRLTGKSTWWSPAWLTRVLPAAHLARD